MKQFNIGDRVRDFHGKVGVIVESNHATGDTACYEVLEAQQYHAEESSLTLIAESAPLSRADVEDLLAYAEKRDVNRVDAFDARQFMYLVARLRQRVTDTVA